MDTVHQFQRTSILNVPQVQDHVHIGQWVIKFHLEAKIINH